MSGRARTAGAGGRALAILIRSGAIVLFLAAWELTVRLGWIDSLFLASPLDTALSLWRVAGAAAPHLYATVAAFTAAFFGGVALALALGFAVSFSSYTHRMFLPLLALGVTVPKVTLLPLFILWFGIGKTPIIVFGALSGFFPMVVNVMTAATEVKQNQVLLATVMGYGRVQIFRKVIFPSMLPVLSSGMFYACNAAMLGVFIVELALARYGLGALVHDLAMSFRTVDLYAAVVLTASIAVVVNMALWYAARYFSRWRA